VFRMPAGDAKEFRLRLAVVGGDVTAARAGPAGVLRRHRQHQSSAPVLFVFELPTECEPALIENRPVEPALLVDVPARLLLGAAA